MQNWHYVALVFAAVTLASAIVVKLFIQILQERAELDESQRMMEIGRNKVKAKGLGTCYIKCKRMSKKCPGCRGNI